MFLAYDVSFVARATSVKVKELTDIIKAAATPQGYGDRLHPPRAARSRARHGGGEIAPSNLSRGLSEGTQAQSDGNGRMSTSPLYTGIFYQVKSPRSRERLGLGDREGM